jgi:hypothetical protein
VGHAARIEASRILGRARARLSKKNDGGSVAAVTAVHVVCGVGDKLEEAA